MTMTPVRDKVRAIAEEPAQLVVPRSRPLARLTAVALVVVVAAAAATVLWMRSTQLPDDAAFRLGDRVVTTDELDRQIDTMRALYGVQQPTDPAQLDRFRRDAAKSYAIKIILDGAARTEGVQTPDDVAAQSLGQYISAQLGDGPDARAQFVKSLGANGTTEATVVDEVKRQIAVRNLMDKVTRPVPVGDDEVRRAFDERRASLGTAERRRVLNIVVPDRGEADSVMQRVRGGESFGEVARTASADPSTRDAGGDMGDVAAAQLEPQYAAAAFGTAVGTPFGPVQTANGWNVGVVTGVTPAIPAVYEQVREPLRGQLGIEHRLEQWQNWVGERIRQAQIQYADGYRPADPDGAPDSARQVPAPPPAVPDAAPRPQEQGASR